MKKIKFFHSPFQILGFMALYASIRILTGGVQDYIEQHQQKDWIVTTAEVIDISSRVESHGSGRRSDSDTVYDITYQYDVDGEVYSDELNGRTKICRVGDEIKIKYDPDAPENSTTTLSPQLRELVFLLIFGTIFGVLGFFVSGIYAWIRRLRRKGEPEEEEVLPPEEYVDPATIKKEPKGRTAVVLQRVLPLLIFLGMIFLSIKCLPGTKAVDAQQFISAVEAEGYTTTDTTEERRQVWRVGSMLEKAISLETDSISMDFCVMDTTDSAGNLYYGMTIPLSQGEEVERNGINYNFYSMENNTLYIAKIRVGSTVIYVSALVEEKAEVVELLGSIGYWKG